MPVDVGLAPAGPHYTINPPSRRRASPRGSRRRGLRLSRPGWFGDEERLRGGVALSSLATLGAAQDGGSTGQVGLRHEPGSRPAPPTGVVE